MIYMIVLAWLICSVLAYGITFAFFQEQYCALKPQSNKADHRMATFVGLCGPVGLVVAYLKSGYAKHGLKYRSD